MPVFRIFYLALLVSLGLAGPGAGQSAKVVRTMLLKQDFAESSVRFTGLPRPAFTVRWASTAIDGQIAICGLVTYPDMQFQQQAATVVGDIYAVYQGRKIMRGMRFFKRVNSARKFDTTPANCALTGVRAPKAPFRVQLDLDPGRVKG
ncbi:MAG: hypothetical protein AAF982_06590 [Pseudomonadota bacterium]